MRSPHAIASFEGEGRGREVTVGGSDRWLRRHWIKPTFEPINLEWSFVTFSQRRLSGCSASAGCDESRRLSSGRSVEPASAWSEWIQPC
ncbi:hypothetical protein NDU88_000606 [Pleurodeles waltl]|uniref:Uncharacterized protein n=1 Tax=Pleurodeles waltl TaxID=8319 RepID=A0AAV7U4G7_PLEWA|nr:hypothetical protein NDU88_000606 [Pleurodeles waltl]